MKTLRKLFFAMVCLTLLFACNETEWKSNNYTVSWDAPTALADGSSIPKTQVLRYNVYIDIDDDKTHDDKILMTKQPVADTNFTIPTIEHKGQYYIGIQALTYKVKDGVTYDQPKASAIAWSSSKANTKKGAFGVKIK